MCSLSLFSSFHGISVRLCSGATSSYFVSFLSNMPVQVGGWGRFWRFSEGHGSLCGVSGDYVAIPMSLLVRLWDSYGFPVLSRGAPFWYGCVSRRWMRVVSRAASLYRFPILFHSGGVGASCRAGRTCTADVLVNFPCSDDGAVGKDSLRVLFPTSLGMVFSMAMSSRICLVDLLSSAASPMYLESSVYSHCSRFPCA